MDLPNNSLERTQPQRDIMDGVAMLRRSSRGRSAAHHHPWAASSEEAIDASEGNLSASP